MTIPLRQRTLSRKPHDMSLHHQLITIDGEDVPIQIRTHPRSKRLRMTVTQARDIVITVPPWTATRMIDAFVQEHLNWIKKTRDRFGTSSFLPKAGDPLEFQRMKAYASTFVHARITVLNAFYEFPIHRITIRNQRSRWGSCSSTGNLSFSYRIALLPPHLADYIIVHELCHLREHNHSPRFWDLVARTIPEYRAYRKQLRTGITHDS